jgi:RNA polymerase sigma-70 factor (ECF subfamily)
VPFGNHSREDSLFDREGLSEMARAKDKALANRLAQGDEDAFNEFDNLYRGILKRAATQMLGWEDTDIEDMVQETFLIATNKIGSYDPSWGKLSTWMRQICVYRCFMCLRKRKRNIMADEADFERMISAHAARKAQDQQAATEKQAQIECLRKAMEQMGALCKSILMLRDQQGCAYAEISKQVKLPMGTVMSRLARCRSKLKAIFLALHEEARS